MKEWYNLDHTLNDNALYGAVSMSTQESEITSQAIAVWKNLSTLADSETDGLLQLDRFVLNKDAYARLGDDDIAEDAPFASYVYSEITSDESLDFSLYLHRGYFTFMIGPVEISYAYGGFGYDSSHVWAETDELLAANPEIIARNILTTIKLLLNGQLSLGCNFHNGQLVALELFLLGFQPQPIGIYFHQKFPLFVRRADTYLFKQNHAVSERVEITDEFPLVPPIVNNERVNRGRAVSSVAGLDPLSKRQAEAIDEEMTMHEFAGGEKGKSTWSQLYATVDFWMIVAGYGVLIWLSRGAPALRSAYESGLGYHAAALVGLFTIPAITGFSLGLRQNQINRGFLPLRYRFEQWVKARDVWRLYMIISSIMAVIGYIFLPLWTLKGDWSGVYSLSHVISQATLLVILPIGCVVIGVLAAVRQTSLLLTAWIGLILSIGLYVTFFTLNDVYMNTAENAPQPPDISYVILFLPALLVGGWIIRIVRLGKRKKEMSLITAVE